MSEPPLLVMHIPKTAGTSLRAVVERQYTPDRLSMLYPGHESEIEALEADARLSPPDAVIGHFRFGLHARLGGRGKYVTVFRDPVDQVVSHFNHLVGVGDPAHRTVLGPDGGLEDFLAHDWARNLQTQYLTGLTADQIEADPNGAFRRAADILSAHFLGFGVVERYAASVRGLGRLAGWRVGAVPVLNRTPDGPRRVHRRSLGAFAVHEIAAANACDCRIYEYARTTGVHRRTTRSARSTAGLLGWLANRW